MKPLSALFDVALLPFKMLKDVADASVGVRKYKSDTRQQLERIEEDIGL